LPHEEHNAVGIHTVISVLRLASSDYNAAVQLAKPEQASQACTTCLHSVARENTKDNVSHKTASSKCRHLVIFCRKCLSNSETCERYYAVWHRIFKVCWNIYILLFCVCECWLLVIFQFWV